MIKKINIMGHEFKVKYENPRPWACNAMGRMDELTNTICVNSELPQSQQEATLIHEIVHVIFSTNGIDVSEEVVTVLASGLYEIIATNNIKIKGLNDEK